MRLETNLNNNQLAFIESNTTDVALGFGPPGSGKTLALIKRAEKISQDPSLSVLILTSTKISADYISNSIGSDFRVNNNLDVMSIYSFAAKIMSSKYPKFQIVDFRQMEKILFEHINLKYTVHTPIKSLSQALMEAYNGKTERLKSLLAMKDDQVNGALNSILMMGHFSWDLLIAASIWMQKQNTNYRRTHLLIDDSQDIKVEWLRGLLDLPFNGFSLTAVNVESIMKLKNHNGAVNISEYQFDRIFKNKIKPKIIEIGENGEGIEQEIERVVANINTSGVKNPQVGILEIPSKGRRLNLTLRNRIDAWVEANLEKLNDNNVDVAFYQANQLKGIELDEVIIVLASFEEVSISNNEVIAQLFIGLTRVRPPTIPHICLPKNSMEYWKPLISYPFEDGEAHES